MFLNFFGILKVLLEKDLWVKKKMENKCSFVRLRVFFVCLVLKKEQKLHTIMGLLHLTRKTCAYNKIVNLVSKRLQYAKCVRTE